MNMSVGRIGLGLGRICSLEIERTEFGNSKLVDPALAKGIEGDLHLYREGLSRNVVEETLAPSLNRLSRL